MIKYNPLYKNDGTQNGALTTAPSDSIVFDLPGLCIWVKGVKLKGTDTTYSFSHDNYITLTNTPGNPEDILIGVDITTLKPLINSWRPIQIDGSEKLGEATDTGALNFVAGTGIEISWDSTNERLQITNSETSHTHKFKLGSTVIETAAPGTADNDLTATTAITGPLTINSSFLDNGLIIERLNSPYAACIQFKNSNGTLGFIGMFGNANEGLYRWNSYKATKYIIWDSGNDGSGSGLDADTLDGYHASDFTDTWRPVYLGGTVKQNSAISTAGMNLKAGSGVTITYLAPGTTGGTTDSGSVNYGTYTINASNQIPSDNITGSGTNNWITKWTGEHTIDKLVAISNAISSQSLSTKFLREDGTWATPSYTTNTNTWRNIYVSGTPRIGTGTNTKAINFASDNLYVYYRAAGIETDNSGNTDYFTVQFNAKDWSGATSNANGTAGYMPAPTSALRDKFLRGDGSWVSLLASDHTYPLSIVADSGNSQVILADSTNYKITAGGSTYIFTTPEDRKVYQEYTSTDSWRGVLLTHLVNDHINESCTDTVAATNKFALQSSTGRMNLCGDICIEKITTNGIYKNIHGISVDATHYTNGSMISFGVGTGDQITYRGIYDDTASKWLIYGNGTNTTLPYGNTYISGALETPGPVRITSNAGQKYILIGNQDSAGTNKPAIISSANAALYFGTGTSWFDTGGTITTTLFLSGGNEVGIGTTSPSTKLHIYGSDAYNMVNIDGHHNDGVMINYYHKSALKGHTGYEASRDMVFLWNASANRGLTVNNESTLNAAKFYVNSTAYVLLHTGNSSVSKSGETLTVNIGDTSESLTNTWRGILNNLTSDSTTDSLSAAQGKALNDKFGNYLPLNGGTMNLGEGLKFHSDDNYFGTNEDARIISLLDGNDTVCDGGLIIDERATSGGVEYVTELLRIRDSEFKWKGLTIYHAGNLPAYPTLSSLGIETRYVTLNGNAYTYYSPYAETLYTGAAFYAPTTTGTSDYILKSNGSGAPTWTNSPIFSGNVTLYSASGDTPQLRFQRGDWENTTYYDYRIYGSNGNLNFDLFSNYDTANSWTNIFQICHAEDNIIKVKVGGNIVYHSGNLPAYPTKASWNYDDMYVSSLTTSGNYLRWVKNGSNNDITIPYATVSNKITMTNSSNMNIWEGTSNRIGYYCYRGTATGCPTGYPYGYLLNYAYYDGNNTWSGLLYFTVSDFGSEIFTRGYHAGNQAWTPWRKFWHELNDGADSGLDADLLDGIHASGLLTNLSRPANTNNISLTIGGTTKVITLGSHAWDSTSYALESHDHSRLSRVSITEANFALAQWSGFYNVSRASSNSSLPGSTSTNVAIHAAWDDGSNKAGLDILINDDRDSNLYFRARTGGGPGSWKTLLDSSNYTNYIYSKSLSDSNYVLNVSINGNYLRVKKNNANTDLTIPFATRAQTYTLITKGSNDTFNFWEGTAARFSAYMMSNVSDGCPVFGNKSYKYGYLYNYAWETGASNVWSGLVYFTVSDFGSEMMTRGYRKDQSSWTAWRRFWNSENDGSGSGLDADLIDGIDSNRIVYGDNATKTTTSSYNYNSYFPSGFYYNSGQFALHCSYVGVNNVAGWTLYTADGTDVPLNFIVQNGGGGGHSYEIISSKGGQTINGNLTATNFYTTSDRNKKTNISLFSEHIRKFQLKDTEKWHYGVIAQEVEEMFRDGEEGNMTVNYNSVLSYYVGQLENRVKELEDEIKELKNNLK